MKEIHACSYEFFNQVEIFITGLTRYSSQGRSCRHCLIVGPFRYIGGKQNRR